MRPCQGRSGASCIFGSPGRSRRFRAVGLTRRSRSSRTTLSSPDPPLKWALPSTTPVEQRSAQQRSTPTRRPCASTAWHSRPAGSTTAIGARSCCGSASRQAAAGTRTEQRLPSGRQRRLPNDAVLTRSSATPRSATGGCSIGCAPVTTSDWSRSWSAPWPRSDQGIASCEHPCWVAWPGHSGMSGAWSGGQR